MWSQTIRQVKTYKTKYPKNKDYKNHGPPPPIVLKPVTKIGRKADIYTSEILK